MKLLMDLSNMSWEVLQAFKAVGIDAEWTLPYKRRGVNVCDDPKELNKFDVLMFRQHAGNIHKAVRHKREGRLRSKLVLELIAIAPTFFWGLRGQRDHYNVCAYMDGVVSMNPNNTEALSAICGPRGIPTKLIPLGIDPPKWKTSGRDRVALFATGRVDNLKNMLAAVVINQILHHRGSSVRVLISDAWREMVSEKFKYKEVLPPDWPRWFVNKDSYRNLLKTVRVGLHPVYSEGFNRTVLEQAQVGLPQVVSPQIWWANQNAGFSVFGPEDFGAMATEIHKLCTDDVYWKSESRKVQAFSSKFTMRRYAEQWKEFLERILQ
jgi:glycosyltransferase involved in cell wall biosynthesis